VESVDTGAPALSASREQRRYDLSIVVPSFRGALRLEALCRRLVPVASLLRAEVILVDDASNDGSFEVMKRLAATHRDVRCARLSERGGQQVATLAGMSLASGSRVATMDDDLEHGPADLSALVERARDGFDLVYGVPRYRRVAMCSGTRSLTDAVRRVGSRLFGLAFTLLIGKPYRLKITGFRVLSADLVARILADRAAAVYISALAFRRRPSVASVQVTPGPRVESRTPVRRLVMTFLQTITSYGPFGRLRKRRPVRSFIRIAETFADKESST
jgi:polyisoprenyl-phosphate glycosyltransferase